MEQNRRSFLGLLGAIGLYPIGARAFGTTIETSATPKGTQKWKTQESWGPKPDNKIGKPSAQTASIFECIVGDFQMNMNGHLYREEIWKKMMWGGMPNHRPYVAYSDTYEPYLRLDRIVGNIVSYDFVDGKVVVRMKVIETPQSKIFRLMVDKAPLFVTPVGECSSLPFHQTGQDGIIPDDYRLKFFNLTNDSAFDCATPLRPAEDQTDHWVPLPGGEHMDYTPSMVLRAKK